MKRLSIHKVCKKSPNKTRHAVKAISKLTSKWILFRKRWGIKYVCKDCGKHFFVIRR